jgi:hypothetical protein
MRRAPRRVVEKARQMLHQEESSRVPRAQRPPAVPAPSQAAGRVRARVVARLKALHPMD